MKKIKFLLMICFTSYVLPFHYDKAVYSGQQGNWVDAHETLNELLIDQPDNADVLYDAGIAAYNLEKFSQACAYFSRAAEYSDQNNLKKRALFNAGNACVACQQLEDALAQYDTILALDKNDEYARYNRDKVAEMLQKQEQEQKQQEEQDQKKQSQDEQQDDDKQEQQQKDQQKNNQQGNDQQGDTDQQSDQQNKDQSGSEKQSQDKERSDGADSSNGDTGQDKRDKEEHGTNAEHNEQGDGEDHSQDKSDQKQSDRNNQKRNQHNAAPDNGSEKSHEKDDASVTSQENKEQGTDDQNGASEDAAHQGQEEMASSVGNKMNDPLLVRILEQQEARDKAINKQLMEAKIRQNGGKNGQNCW